MYNILTYGLQGRRVRLQPDGVYWIRKGHVLKKIEDWSASLEQGQDMDDVKNALMLMGAVISDSRFAFVKWTKLSTWDGERPAWLLDGSRVVSYTLIDHRYTIKTDSGEDHYGSAEVLIRVEEA
jgi:hypothetical protein